MVEKVVQSSPEALTSLVSPILMVLIPLPCHIISFQTLTSVYLPNNTVTAGFAGCWLCVPPRSNSPSAFVAPPAVLLDPLTSPLVNCSEPNHYHPISFPHLSLTNCFNPSGTHFVLKLDSADCSNPITLSTITQLLCPNIHNASILFGNQADHCLPARWSGLVPWCSFFQS